MKNNYSNFKSSKTNLLFFDVFFNKIKSTSKKLIILLLIFLGFNFSYSQSPSTFTTSGTWICPRGVTSIQVEAIGGGAGGRNTANTNNHAGGGGGGGAYAKRVAVTVIPGTIYTITVGTAGNGGASTVASTAGVASTATFGLVTITAAGGSIGVASNTGTVTGGAGGTVALSVGDFGSIFAGGNGGSGFGGPGNNGSGGGGGSAAGSLGTSNAGGNATNATTPGAGGFASSNYGGAGGAGGYDAVGSAAPTVAGNYGGGGGGAGHKGNSGGAGQPGVIIITFTCPTETAAAGPDQSICLSTTTLAGNTPTSAGLTGLWTVVSGTATITTPTSPTSGVTGLVVGSATLRWTINNGRCGITSDDVIITRGTVPTASITPSPADTATGVCYAGTSPITSVSWAATAGATSYYVYFGAGALLGPFTVSTNSYSTGTLLASTLYSWRVVARNACGDAVGSATWTFTTSGSPCIIYCTPTASTLIDGTGITNVSFSGVNNPSTNTIVYNDYTSISGGTAAQGSTMPISITTATGNKSYNVKVWIDWNNDGDFTDTGEEMFSGNVKSNTISGVLNIPFTAILGNHRMRVGSTQGQGNGVNFEIATPCFTGVRGQFEDYTLTITAAVLGCTIPPTVTTSPSSVTVANLGDPTFTAVFGNSPTSYVWEVSTDGGTNWTPITNGGIYSTATTATLTLLDVTYAMNGFRYRVSATNACGTSAYTVEAILTVTPTTYCTPTHTTTTSHWIATVFSDGNLKDTTYSGVPANSATGYNNYSSTIIARQSPGGGMNISFILGSSPSLNRQRVSCFVDWNSDGVYTYPSEQVYTSGTTGLLEATFGIVIPVSINPGNYRMRLRTQQLNVAINDACNTLATGETEDYTISIVPDCAAKIQSVTNGAVCGAGNPVTISAVGLGGTTKYRWYTSETGGTFEAETTAGTYSPTLSVTTTYYVAAFNGSCESLVRTRVIAKVTPTANIVFSPSNPITCEEDTIITISAASDFTEIELFYEDFDGTSIGMTASTGTPYTSPGADSPWQVKTSTYQPSGTAVWKPSINSGSIDNNFAFTTSDYNGTTNIVTRYDSTAAFNTTDFISLNLTFNMYFSYYEGVGSQNFKAQISPNNGANWADLATYTADLGKASRFDLINLSVPNTYFDLTQVKIRFQYTSGVWTDGVAIDNIRFYGVKELNSAFSWTSSIPVSGYTNIACTPPFLYTNQTVSTIYLKPTLTQLEATNFPIAVTATLANGCPITQTITVANNARVWKGLDVVDETNWNDADNWKPAAIPTIDNCVIIPNTSIVKGTNFHGYAKNLVVKSTGNLNVQEGNSVTVKEWVKVETNGIFELENTASLVQVDNVTSNNNLGEIRYKRNTTLRRYDYTYLSSPVESQVVNSVTQAPLVTGPVYKWNPTIVNPNGGEGNWENALGDTMVKAKGYTVRSPDSFPFTASTYYGLFKGVPNNGIITIPVSRGTWSFAPPYLGNNGTEINSYSDNWNLIGNPYPSSIRGSYFILDNSTKLEGNIRLWTHATLPLQSQTQPFYGSFGYNYTPNDYLSYNFTGTSCCPLAAADLYIGAGQGFFVQMIDGPATTDFVTFNNTLRAATYDNSYFFRNSNQYTTNSFVENLERNRIWLDIINPSNQSSRILVGNIEGATNARDSYFDANAEISGTFTFYSLIGVEKFFIQGRAVNFDITDEVPLGYKVPTAGTYSIAIAAVDGYFTQENIYIKDMLLDTIHDVKISPYQFTSAPGQFDNRFKIVYYNSTLGNSDFDYGNSVNVVTNNAIAIQSTNEPMESIVVYDILGRTLATYNKINANEFTITNLLKNNTTLLLQIKLQNGVIVNQKVIY